MTDRPIGKRYVVLLTPEDRETFFLSKDPKAIARVANTYLTTAELRALARVMPIPAVLSELSVIAAFRWALN